jgi:hypothetical protein
LIGLDSVALAMIASSSRISSPYLRRLRLKGAVAKHCTQFPIPCGAIGQIVCTYVGNRKTDDALLEAAERAVSFPPPALLPLRSEFNQRGIWNS